MNTFDRIPRFFGTCEDFSLDSNRLNRKFSPLITWLRKRKRIQRVIFKDLQTSCSPNEPERGSVVKKTIVRKKEFIGKR